ncbi:MAG: ATP-dependent sacrificial sulfur transferase LarE [Pirellulaceae bacterium]|nr:ATP-dependent sacrificial sulfur transferase LarE [Pirellulaceae bacterium]
MQSQLESPETSAVIARLIDAIRARESCVVAFSGGVDSSVVAQAAFEALGNRAVAITGVGPSVSQEDIRFAKLASEAIGIRHLLLDTDEMRDPNYLDNNARRCFHCKSNLYERLGRWAEENDFATILSGTNADDLGDYRPGLDAARDYQVVAPLADLGIDKQSVRRLAEFWSLPVADRPASPCLASRIAYGEAVTADKLRMIELAESRLRLLDFHDVRVRLHPGSLARIEVALEDLPRMLDSNRHIELADYFRSLGFKFVTLDIAGRQSGSLNQLLPVIQRHQ